MSSAGVSSIEPFGLSVHANISLSPVEYVSYVANVISLTSSESMVSVQVNGVCSTPFILYLIVKLVSALFIIFLNLPFILY